eukprot:scaffold188013_cov35-Tisochrysis_lutea.AAC.1
MTLDKLKNEQVLLNCPHRDVLLCSCIDLHSRLGHGVGVLEKTLASLSRGAASFEIEVVYGMIPRRVVGGLRVVIGECSERVDARARYFRHQIIEEDMVIGLRPTHGLLGNRRDPTRRGEHQRALSLVPRDCLRGRAAGARVAPHRL